MRRPPTPRVTDTLVQHKPSCSRCPRVSTAPAALPRRWGPHGAPQGLKHENVDRSKCHLCQIGLSKVGKGTVFARFGNLEWSM